MIDKVLPQFLDSSKDARYRDKNSMYIARNVQINEDLMDDSSGNSGVLKPKSGNTPINSGELFPPTDTHQRRVIGSVTDDRLNVVYFFVYSTNANEQGVYAYDESNSLSEGQDGEIKRVFTSSLFNFPQNGFVKGDVVHSSSFKKGVIYFTDNVNEPRRLDVYRALTDGDSYTSDSNQNAFHTNDFITACPKTPLHPITFYFDQDSNKSTSEFEGVEGFQFAYQCVYKSGEETALSTYSDIAVPPAYVQQGTLQSATLLQNNRCVLTVPRIVDGVPAWSAREIEKVRIVGRIGNAGSFYLIDEIDVGASETEYTYNFYNDKVISAIPLEDQQKQFDSLPRKARAQTVVDNRLFYANYVEGYDNVDIFGDPVIPSANFSVVPAPRPTDFINLSIEATPVILAQDVDYDSSGIVASTLNETPNRRAGYKLDMSDLPEVITSGSIFSVSIKAAPDKNFHVYNTTGGASHHLSKTLFGRTNDSILDETSNHLTSEYLFFGENEGVSSSSLTVKDPGTAGAGVASHVGTSASNPLIIKSGILSFSCTFSFTQDITSNGSQQIKEAIVAILNGESPQSFVEVLDSQITSSFNYNLLLEDQDEILVASGNDYRKNLICAAKGEDGFASNYFIINSASVEFGLEQSTGPNNMEGEDGNLFFNLKINLLDVSDVKTCVPVVFSDDDYDLQAIEKWQVYGLEYLTEYNVTADLENAFFINEDPDPFNSIDFQSIDSRLALANGIIENVSQLSLSDSYSIVDGESYHNNYSFPEYAIESSGEDPTVTPFGNIASAVDQGSINFNNIFCSSVSTNALINTFDGLFYNGTPILYQSTSGWNITDGYIDPSDIINLPSQIELISFNGYLTESVFGTGLRSFKTDANHQFGVVYYDERGRSGPVMPLGSVYVPGYSDSERGPNKGRVEILVELLNNPPAWAHNYQIVYAGNSNKSDFFQYTAGGAFVAQGDNQDANIYVSLNYLQNNTTASYAHGFGAVNNEGGDDMYVFKKGDKLKVISYYEDENIREFPQNIEFDIVDSVVLGSNIDDNPLYIDGEDGATSNSAPKAKTGQFLVLKNNSSAVGFSHYDVSQSSIVNSQSHLWNDRCLIEVYTPSKRESRESMAYYEISECFNVIRDATSGELDHQTNSIRLSNGDVWWRRMAVNMPNYEPSINGFANIILGPSSEGVFRDYFVESRSFTDVIPRCEVNGFGKLKLEDKRSREIRRDSSITYSDKNNYASSLVRFTSFNGAKLPYKDISNEHGSITSILNYSDSIFCIQEDKCSAITVSRDIISDAIGNETLITSNEIIGSQRFYAGNFGCEDHPESVTVAGNNIYFVSVANKEVYRFNPSNGIYPISETGLKSYFREMLSGSLNRVVGGYDPVNDEFLLSWHPWSTLNLIGSYITSYVQRSLNIFVDESEDVGGGTVIINGGNPGDGVGTGDGDTGGGNGTNGGGGEGYNEGYTAGFEAGEQEGVDAATDAILEELTDAFGDDVFGEGTDTIAEAISDIQAEFDSDDATITGLQADLDAAEATNDSLNAQINNLNGQIAFWQAEAAAADEEAQALYLSQIEELQKRVDDLTAEVESQKLVISGLNDMIEVLNTDLAYEVSLRIEAEQSLEVLQIEYDQYREDASNTINTLTAERSSIVSKVAMDMDMLVIDALLRVTYPDGRPILTANDFPQPLNQFIKEYQDNGVTETLVSYYLNQAPFISATLAKNVSDSINSVIQMLADQITDVVSGGGGIDNGGEGSGGDDSNGGGVDPGETFRGVPLVFDPSSQLTPVEIRTAMLNVLVHSSQAISQLEGEDGFSGLFIGAGENRKQLEIDTDGTKYFIDDLGIRYNVSGPNYFDFVYDSNNDGVVQTQDLLNFLLAYGQSYDLSDQPTITRAN